MIELLKSFFQRELVKRLITLVLLVWILYLMRSMLNLFLLTFIFTYLSYSFQSFITRKIKFLQRINKTYITLGVFFLLFLFIAVVIYQYVPVGLRQFRAISFLIEKNIEKGMFDSLQSVFPVLADFNLKDFSTKGMNYILSWSMDIGKFGLNIFMALILSLFFMIENDKIKEFFNKFKESRVGPAVSILQYFGSNFLNSFGKVVQAQILISATNTCLSIITLAFMRFNDLFGLAIMIFILGLIPVAGTFVSLIPLSIMAYYIGGFNYIIYIIILITVLHTLEAYVLNPKFMSQKTELPVFITFLILVISEHFFGVWGLLLGIPTFIFFLDLMNIKTVVPRKSKQKAES